MSEEIIYEEEFPFETIVTDDGEYMFTNIDDAKKQTGYDESHIWSVTECENTWTYGASHHYINLIGYVVTHEAHDDNTYYEDKMEWRDEQELAEAEFIIHNALVAAVDDSIGRDSGEAKKIEEAWELITKKLRGENDE